MNNEYFFVKYCITKLTDYYLEIISQVSLPFTPKGMDMREEGKTIYNRNRNRLWNNKDKEFLDVVDIYISGYHELLEFFWNRVSYKPLHLDFDENNEIIHDLSNTNMKEETIDQMGKPENILVESLNKLER